MNVTCPECSSVFRVDTMKVPEGGVRARCSVCGGIISLTREEPAEAAAPLVDVARSDPENAPQPPPSLREAPERDPGADRPVDADAVPAPSPFAASSTPAASGSAATPAFSPQPTPPGRRPINPFLNNDPGMKAKRLARALVSDMITYQPQKREEGLRNNTLKQLFREEIKKSYEEYVEQVGREVAESTAHFQDALNDILANGRKVF